MSEGVSALADRFFAAVSRGDLAELDELYSPDVAVWHNYDDVEQTRAESLRLLSWLAAKAARCVTWTCGGRFWTTDSYSSTSSNSAAGAREFVCPPCSGSSATTGTFAGSRNMSTRAR